MNAFSARRAFTLLELLITVSIIALLTGMGLGVFKAAGDKARKVKEVNAGRTLITAFLNTVADRNGQYMAGYDKSVDEIPLPGGGTISGEPAHRYPFRLAPYFDFQMKDTVLVNYNTSQIDQNQLQYMTSLNPALGMNSFFVGGTMTSADGTISYPNDCLQRPANATHALLVFASAGFDEGAKRINGYFKLTPPKLSSTMWRDAKWTSKSAPADYGNVDARYGGEAVCAFTDGGVRLLGIEALRDMRLWNINAADQDKRDYTVANTPGGVRL